MKIVMIIIDGLGDEPIPELNGKTPLESSFIPNIHYIANRGQIGCIKTTFPKFPVESMVCIMGLIGYEPDLFYPSGRASFEALAKGISLSRNDLVLRSNIISIDTRKQILTDFTAGLISDSDARKIISQIITPHSNWDLYPGQSYRNIMIVRDAEIDVKTLKCYEPHMNIGKKIKEILPSSLNAKTAILANELSNFLLDTQRQISNMALSKNCKANMLWFWSPSLKPIWPSFKERTGLNAAFVGGLDFLHGIAMAAKIHFDIIPGATGYINTDYRAKGEYTIEYMKDFDFVLTHINAPDEEAHLHNYLGKIKAIENIDQYIVGPVLQKLIKELNDEFVIIICGDHSTRCSDGKHTNDPVPYAMFGTDIMACNTTQFSEKNCRKSKAISSIRFFRNFICNRKNSKK